MRIQSLVSATLLGATPTLTPLVWAAEPASNHDAQTRPPDSDSSEDAEALLSEARRLYEAGDLNGALRQSLHCYEKAHTVNLVFNLAQLYRELGNCPTAIEYYQRYVQAAGDGGRVDDARHFVDDLSRQCSVTPQPNATPSASPSAAASVETPGPIVASIPAATHDKKFVNKQSGN